jgi:hypothetical protein
MKRLTRTLILSTALALMPAGTLAVTASPTATPAATDARLANLKARGTSEINRRKENLTAASQKIQASTKTPASEKQVLTSQLNLETATLDALAKKLAAETTLAGARADVQSIVTDYRVYALMLPKTRMVASIDRFSVAEEKLNLLHDKLLNQVRAITDSPDTSKDLQDKLAAMQQEIDTAKSAADGLVPVLLALKPTDYNANHAVLVQYRDALKGAQEHLKAARDDAKAILEALKTAK